MDAKRVEMEVVQEVVKSWIFVPTLKFSFACKKEGEVKGSYVITTNSTEKALKVITVPFSYM